MKIIDYVRVNNAPVVEYHITDETHYKEIACFTINLLAEDDEYADQIAMRNKHDRDEIFNISPLDSETIRVWAVQKSKKPKTMIVNS